MQSEQPPVLNLLSDDPRDGTDARPDELGRTRFATYLGELLDSIRSQSESSVLALIGAWGSGKSSVLELLLSRLRATDWTVATLNPWSYADAPSLQRGFFTELTSALPPDDQKSSPRRKLGEFARTISPLGKLAGVVGIDGHAVAETIADLLIGDSSATATKKAVEATLRDAKQPILMIIDDLDRLTPDELLEVLKLVRLVGRLPHVYYLLSYDERTLLDVLRKTPIAADDEGRARAYLEKIVQVRLDMPTLRESQRSLLFNEGLKSIVADNGVLLTEEDSQRIEDLHHSVIDSRLTTPRAITRFLGQVQAFYPPLRNEVDFVDFLLVSWLRTQEPGVYSILQRDQAALLGREIAPWLGRERNAEAAEERRKHWSSKLAAANVDAEHRDGVVRVLSSLFPQMQSAFSSTTDYSAGADRKAPRSIANPDYYDRYISFGVPDEDLSDELVRTALTQLVEGKPGPEVARFTVELGANTARAVRKIQMFRESATVPEAELFGLFSRIWPDLDNEPRELFFGRPRKTIENAAGECLLSLDPADAAAVAEQARLAPEGDLFVTYVVWGLHRAEIASRTDSVPMSYDLEPLRQVASAALSQLHRGHHAHSPFEPGTMQYFLPWEDMDANSAHAWLRSQVDRGPWTLADTLGALTSVAIELGGSGHRSSIGRFLITTAEETFSFDRIFTELADEIAAAEPLSGGPNGSGSDVEATPLSRTQYALHQLKLESERRKAQPDTPA